MDKREEIRRRLPRLVTNMIMAIIFWLMSVLIPGTLPSLIVPGINTEASTLVWILLIIIMAIFLIRALTDALVLGDVFTDVLTKKLGVKDETTSKRAARELVYIIAIVLVVTAVSPLLLDIQDVGYYLSTATVYIGLGLVILFIYDIGRTVYRIIEEKAESLADYLTQAKQDKSSESSG
jgi:cation transport ATPase